MQALLYVYDFGPPGHVSNDFPVEPILTIPSQPLDYDTFVPADQRPGVPRTMFAIARELGHEPFAQAASQAWRSTKFAYLTKKLAKHPERYKTHDAFMVVYAKHDELSEGVRRRYAATLFEGGYNLEALDVIGCMNPACETKTPLKRLFANGMSWETYSPENRKLAEGWGRNTKLCGG